MGLFKKKKVIFLKDGTTMKKNLILILQLLKIQLFMQDGHQW